MQHFKFSYNAQFTQKVSIFQRFLQNFDQIFFGVFVLQAQLNSIFEPLIHFLLELVRLLNIFGESYHHRYCRMAWRNDTKIVL